MKAFLQRVESFSRLRKLYMPLTGKRHFGNRLLNPIPRQNRKTFFLPLQDQINRVKSHLRKAHKNPSPTRRPRVFVAVHHVNWEKHGLVEGWANLADVVYYDWGDSFDQYASTWHERGKSVFNIELLQEVTKAHNEKPVDLFFSYLSGRWVFPGTIKAIGELGPITINISFDDKIKFWGYQEPSGLSGNAEIAPKFDVCITSQSSEDVSKYVAVDANPLFLPPAANPSAFSTQSATFRTIPISFIGQCYGKRSEIIEYLRAHNLPVQTFGKGWSKGELSFTEMKNIYARSLINLGFGYIGDSDELVGLKGRDFEVPLAGGLYLTTYNPELAKCFAVGREIDCYQDKDELVNKLKFYLANPDVAIQIGTAGRARCLRDHTWEHRFKYILDVVGLRRSENMMM